MRSLQLKFLIIFCLLLLNCPCAVVATQLSDSVSDTNSIASIQQCQHDSSKKVTRIVTKSSDAVSILHPKLGTSVSFGNGKQIKLFHKLHNYPGERTLSHDPDIYSPKSVNIHPSANKFYVNSLEGGKTIVYGLPNLKKLAVINHRFDDSHSHLWAAPSGLFKFQHYSDNVNSFTGKPVESVFSHNGKYLWIPYYRRSFDINAQDPSAIAVIDTSSDTIVRIMEAGVLPKMIAISPDEKTIAVTHWGDNTVGIIDVSSRNPKEWKYKANIAVGRQLFHQFSLTSPINRDTNTGEALRGTVFTPDGHYILVGCMSGGGIAVIDAQKLKYLGKLTGIMHNVRHLVIKGDWLYASINATGYVQRVKLNKIFEGISKLGESKQTEVSGWENVKVAPGARTLELSPRGDYIFVACNLGSRICIADSTMQKVAEIAADSYPVGLDISPDGKWLITTSQGRNNRGGNCVDIFKLTGIDAEEDYNESVASINDRNIDNNSDGIDLDKPENLIFTKIKDYILLLYVSIGGITLVALFAYLYRKRKSAH